MLRAILNKSWRQHPTKQQLYGYLPPITKTIQVRRTRHVGNSWRSGDELISDLLLWIPSHGRQNRTYIQRYLSSLQPNGRVWHKAFVKVDPGAEPYPSRAWHSQKYLGPRRHFPKKGAPQASGDKPNPPKRVKAWEDGPRGLRYVPRLDTPDQIRAVDTTADRSVTHLLDTVD